MNWLKLYIILLFSSTFSAFSISNDTIITKYKYNEYVTICRITVNASDSINNRIIDEFIYQSQNKFNDLYKWAFKGLNLKGENNELIAFDFKTSTYNKTNGISRTKTDIIVPHIVTLKDIAVDTKLIKSVKNGNKSVSINVLHSDAFLKKTIGTFTVHQQKDNISVYQLETKVQFGKFFDMFITQFRYKEILEWRLNKLLTNLKLEAESREKKLKKQ